MNRRKPIAWVGGLAVWAGLAAAPAIWAAVPDSEHVNKLLADAKASALVVKEDTAAMEGFARMDVNWETHAVAINQIKDHLNALERAAARLDEVKDEAAPWQRTAINRMTPFLDELEGYTLAVIERITEQPKRLFTPEYKDFLAANADYAADLATMISNFVDYGRTREKVERLAAKLEIPAR
jgi:hypothetical protein